jgi:mannose-6-phosphate isomerase-like protein (cupin superfamily)
MTPIDIAAGFAAFSETWRPQVCAELNGQQMKLVKVQGEFPWHHHADVEEMFFVWRGRIRLEFRDSVLELEAGQCAVVPRGVEHRPVAENLAEVILFEPAGVRNTGNLVDDRFTAPEYRKS